MTETTLPKLRVSRKEAGEKIKAHIKKGKLLRDQRASTPDELLSAFGKWSDYNKDLLLSLFTSILADEYDRFCKRPYMTTSAVPSSVVDEHVSFYVDPTTMSTVNPVSHEKSQLSRDLAEYRKEFDKHIDYLEGICERLDLYEEPSDVLSDGGAEVVETSTDSFGNEVFIVHGHDGEAVVKVARLVEKLGLMAIILNERANRGQTIPEKFEEHAGKASFAIVLLTPDDVGASKDEKDNLKPRARQNVVLELGYFWGRLGRARVCVLHKEEVEIPSDIQGLIYVPMDDNNGWKFDLAQEMNQAGLPIDLNTLKQKR